MRAVCTSWRLGSVALMSFSSGLPLGLVWIAIPAWMARIGVDIKVIGLFTLAQAPWSFKFLWSPLMDRYAPPFLGRKRGWILLSQIGLLLTGLWLAGVSDHPDAIWVIAALTLATGLFAATQDIAYDAYAVEVLRPHEQGLAVGSRTALYRAAMTLSGGLSITLASVFDVSWFGHPLFTWHGSWRLVNLILALCYVPCALITWLAPEPELPPSPPTTLKDAVWEPFVGLMSKQRVLEILAFVLLFKLSDNLTQALLRPFFVQIGFSDVDVGIASSTIGNLALVAGALLGGALTNWVGLGRALWITGLLQILSNLGYAVLAEVGPSRTVMYLAQGFEYLCGGLGTGAFGVLLLRLTQKRFSATQYALLTSLFSIPRVLAGPPAALLADAVGWRDFFVLTVFSGIPGMVMLARFVPWSVREPEFPIDERPRAAPLSRAVLAIRATCVFLLVGLVEWATLAGLDSIKTWRATKVWGFGDHLVQLAQPTTVGGRLTLAGIFLVAACVALGSAALWVARRGVLAPGRQGE
jgi:MFS transporter, PAT family, beta-lactamase induction signal transducer AmpG